MSLIAKRLLVLEIRGGYTNEKDYRGKACGKLRRVYLCIDPETGATVDVIRDPDGAQGRRVVTDRYFPNLLRWVCSVEEAAHTSRVDGLPPLGVGAPTYRALEQLAGWSEQDRAREEKAQAAAEAAYINEAGEAVA